MKRLVRIGKEKRITAFLWVLLLILAAFLSLKSRTQEVNLRFTSKNGLSGCVFLTDPQVKPIFCDTFDKPARTGNRSGELDGVIWGVSRVSSDNDPKEEKLNRWQAFEGELCGIEQVGQDISVCNGQFVEGVNDGGNVAILAAYPKQPFDIKGRTGLVTFEVSNDTNGTFSTWPEFSFTDQPVPAPHHTAPGIANYARNSFGFSLAQLCDKDISCGKNISGDLSNCVGVNKMFLTRSYQPFEIDFVRTGCVARSTEGGLLNHFEVRISENRVEVWGTDPGKEVIRKIAEADVQLPLTRGLIWIEDVHYNAGRFYDQSTHAFSWDNVGFDGPNLPKDLAFDVADNSSNNLGYLIPKDEVLDLSVPGVHSKSAASSALLTFNFWPQQSQMVSFNLNGHGWHDNPWPYGFAAPLNVSHTVALPVSLNEINEGDNRLQLKTVDGKEVGVSVVNVDLILVGAGGI
jgi:hypothetical protein